MNIIHLKDIEKKRGDFLLQIKDLAIPKGYITGFIGENGAGKTTTMSLIMNCIHADTGSVEVFGKEIASNEVAIKEQIGYVGAQTGYPKEAKLKHIKSMVAPFYPAWDEKLFQSYIKRFNINMQKKYKELSTGKQKQFALIMALSHHPKLILLDEPTANLDPIAREEILELIREHMQDEEVTTFYSTHITSDLEKAADYILYMHNGKIKFYGEKQTIEDTYCIVTSKKELFTEEMKKEVLGVQKTAFMIEALMKDKKKAYEWFGEEAKYRKPTLEELMMFWGKYNVQKEGRK